MPVMAQDDPQQQNYLSQIKAKASKLARKFLRIKERDIHQFDEKDFSLIDIIKINDVLVRVIDFAYLGTLNRLQINERFDVDHKTETLSKEDWIKEVNASSHTIATDKVSLESAASHPDAELSVKTYYVTLGASKFVFNRYAADRGSDDKYLAAFNIILGNKDDWQHVKSQTAVIALQGLFHHQNGFIE